jgi:putative membrane protein
MTVSVKRRAVRAVIALTITVAAVVLLVLWQPSGFYPWLKVLHVLAVISWMAGMLYLPRLFVYHCQAEPGSRQSETFKVMERRLLLAIINPAMIMTWVVGLWLAWDGGWYSAGWFQAKLALGMAMSGVHGYFVNCVHAFAADQNRHSEIFYRVINEVPTLIMIGMVILTIVQPF